MRRIVLFMHTSLDGFVAGPNGEMEWINVDAEIFDDAAARTANADTALYGRVTYEMMQAYWPTAGDQPDASKHDVEHSEWYNRVQKVILSHSMKGADLPNTTIIDANVGDEIRKLKAREGQEIVIFGSPSAAHALMAENLIDDYWLLINPVLLGQGIPLFKDIQTRIKLELAGTKVFTSGVVMLHYVSPGAS